MDESLIAVIAGTIGYLVKSAWDGFSSRRSDRASLALSKKVELLEKQLSEFYWPVYLRLQKDNAVWVKLLDRSREDDSLAKKIGKTVEELVILPNHQEIVTIIESKAHLAQPDAKMSELLRQYLRHIAVYQSIRAAGCYDRDPVAFGEPWPVELFPLIEQRTLSLQQAYEDYLKAS